MLARRGRVGIAEHPRDLRDPVLAVNLLHVAGGQAATGHLAHHEVPLRAGSDLRQVGDDQHLAAPRHLRQRGAHLGPDLATDPGVDLVKDQRRHLVVPGQHHLEREHDPGELAPRCRTGERTRLQAGVEPDHEGHPLLPRGLHPPERRQFHVEPPAREPELRQQPRHPARQPGAGFLPLGAERIGGRLSRPFRGHPARGQLPEVEVSGVEQVELAGRLGPGGEDGLEGGPVLLLQAVDQVPASLNLSEPRGVLLQAVGIALSQPGQLGEAGVRAVEQLAPRRDRPIDAFQPAEQPVSLAERGQDTALLLLQQRGEPAGLLGEGARVPQPARLEVERLILAGGEPGVIDLPRHGAPVVGAAPHLVPLLPQRLLLGAQLAHAPPRVLQGGALGEGAGERVEDVALGVRVQQGLGLVLAVQVDKQAAQAGQGADGGRAAVHPGAGTPVHADLAPEHEAVVLRLHTQLLQAAPQGGVGHLEGALDRGALGARADQAAVGAGAEEQGHRVHQHGLARPGLAGQRVEAGAELEGNVRDGDEIAHAQLGDHRITSRSERSPQLSFWRMRVK